MVVGSINNDVLNGSALNDTIMGDDGDHEIWGSDGHDLAWGGAGADTFVFSGGHDNDRILDFEDGLDIIKIQHSQIGSFSQLDMDQVGADVVLHLPGGELTLVDTQLSEMTAGDFWFV